MTSVTLGLSLSVFCGLCLPCIVDCYWTGCQFGDCRGGYCREGYFPTHQARSTLNPFDKGFCALPNQEHCECFRCGSTEYAAAGSLTCKPECNTCHDLGSFKQFRAQTLPPIVIPLDKSMRCCPHVNDLDLSKASLSTILFRHRCKLCPHGKQQNVARSTCIACPVGTAGTGGRCTGCASGKHPGGDRQLLGS